MADLFGIQEPAYLNEVGWFFHTGFPGKLNSGIILKK